MELQAMTREQLIEKVEKLSADLEKSLNLSNELQANVLEHEKIENELRAENDSLKKENTDFKKSSENYWEWWQDESEKNKKMKESLKAAALVLHAIANEAAAD